MIDGGTELIAHLGYPTRTFTAPLIYNPYFASVGVNAVVVPMGLTAGNFAAVFRALFTLVNLRGALVTMPHKATTLALVDDASPRAQIAGACNVVLRRRDGTLLGDMFDGEGFVRAVLAKGRTIAGARALVVGCGGVGAAIAAALMAAGIARLGLVDIDRAAADRLAARLAAHDPTLALAVGDEDPQGCDLVVNATPLGMTEDDPLPLAVERVAPSSLVADVVLAPAMTRLLRAASAKGCAIQVGTDMLFEQIPACLDFFGLPVATAATLRTVARLSP